MGACYSVTLKVNVLDEQGAIKALNEHIANDTGVDYSLDKYATKGITTETFDGLMKILLADLQMEVSIYQQGKFTIYESDFNASYGWERVMMEWFEVLAPFLSNGSQMLIYPDEDYDKLVIKNGKCVQIH
jgi:hypothetical protein